jgi:alkylhydroperoxidase family enzyme
LPHVAGKQSNRKEQCLVPRIQPVEPENAPEESRPLMEQAAKATGKMLNFYKQMAVSPKSFKGYLDLYATLQGGALDRQTQESIAVAVSDFDGCVY